MSNPTAGPTKQEIEAVFARLRSQAANKVNFQEIFVINSF